jgi:hypothetical protein
LYGHSSLFHCTLPLSHLRYTFSSIIWSKEWMRNVVHVSPGLWRQFIPWKLFVRWKFINQKWYSHYSTCKSHQLINKSQKNAPSFWMYCDTTAETYNSGPTKVVHCWATAGKHFSTATKTPSHVNNAWAITKQQPTIHITQKWRISWKRCFLWSPCWGYITRTTTELTVFSWKPQVRVSS